MVESVQILEQFISHSEDHVASNYNTKLMASAVNRLWLLEKE